MTTDHKKHISWNSRWTFIMAAAGSAIGLGNIWKFPYITGENGGGAFVLVYLLCIAIIGLPVLMAETLMGRHSRRNPISAMSRLASESDTSKAWVVIGLMGTLAGILIMSFYSVVAGWVMDYIVESARGSFVMATQNQVTAYFESGLTGNPKLQLAWHTAFVLMTVAVVAAGVTKGLGNAVRFMMPLLAILLVILLGYSISVGNVAEAARFLFSPDFSRLSAEGVLKAMGHSFFTLSIGMGAIMAYGSYMPAKVSIARTAITIVLLDTVFALMAGMAIFPLVFAHGIEPGSGPGLMFISLPMAFGGMPFGTFFACLFFILVLIAAWTSSISLIEPAVAWISENTRISRYISAGIIGLITWLGGVACIYREGVFGQLDMLASNIMLPLGGLLMAIFVGWIMKRKIAKKELEDLSYNQFNLWYATLRVFTPIGIVVVFAYSVGLLK